MERPTRGRYKRVMTLRRGAISLVLTMALLGAATLPPGRTRVAHAAPRPTAPAPTSPQARAVPKAPSARTAAEARWVAATPDEMLDAMLARATRPGVSEAEALAALFVLPSLEHVAAYGRAEAAYGTLGAEARFPAPLRGEARLRKMMVAPLRRGSEAVPAAQREGLATSFVVVGPFRDTGGGLARREGPEADGVGFARKDASYSWGTVEVTPRPVPPVLAGPEGIPLDALVFPRTESCSYVATRVEVPTARSFVVGVAATGQARATFDGVDLGASEEVQRDAMVDRIAAKVDAPAGSHLVTVKTCTGALGDSGRVRVRFYAEDGAPVVLASSAELVDTKAAPALRVQKLGTPLSRALAQTATTENALLTGAIARILGGADDDRSPRAPGLLESLTRRPSVAPDVLALAGWIAPFGAQRSGWLEQALARARTNGDEGSRAFVERRLVEGRLHAGLGDWAMATARGAGLPTATDPEAIQLYATVLSSLGSEALRLEALDRLEAARKRLGDRVPTMILSDLAGAVGSFSVERALAAREALARRGFVDTAYVSALLPRGAAAVATAVRRAFDDGRVESCDEGLALAGIVARTGDGAASLDAYQRVAFLCPNRAEVWSGVAHGLAAAGSGGSPAVLTALRRARDLAPGDGRVRAELALRRGDGQAEGREDERYLVPSSTVLARRKGPGGTTPDVADRQLYWLRAVVMHADKRVSQLMHYGREIVIAPRTQDELFEPLPIEGDTVEILRARVHRKDGGTDFPAEEHNEGARAYIRWPDLAPGDVVEVAIRNWTSRPVGGRGDAPFSFFDYAGATTTHPLLYNEVIVERAPGASLFVDVLGGAPDKRDEREERGRHITRLVWNNPPNVPDEPLAPKLTEVVPMIVGSTYRTWDDFRTWYKDAVQGFTEPDAEVRRLAAELTRGKTTPREKMEALFNFVADDIRYVNYVSGEWWLPNRPQQVLARREGDCDDKALLLITLLKAVGIEAQEVMVQTRQTAQPSLLRARNIAVPLFDHGIAFLPGPNGGTWLDATSPQSRLGPLPAMDAGGMALRLEDRGPPVPIPFASPAEHGNDVRWLLQLDADGSATLEGEETHTGDSAFWLRGNLTEEGARAQYVEQALVAGWLPTVEVDRDIAFRGDLPRGQAWVKYRARSSGFARREQGELVVSVAPSRSLTSSLAPLARRTLPVVLPSFLAPSHSDRTVRLVAPSGYVWADPPSPGEASSPFGTARFEVKRDPKDARVVVASRSLVFAVAEVPVDRYDAFRTWLGRVDALMNRRLRLLPQATAARGGS